MARYRHLVTRFVARSGQIAGDGARQSDLGDIARFPIKVRDAFDVVLPEAHAIRRVKGEHDGLIVI